MNEINALKRDEIKALQADVSGQLRCLVSLRGYGYARNIASQIAKEFECKPNDPNWATYSTIKWSLDKLFNEIDKLANFEIQTPKEVVANANSRRNRTRKR